MKFEGRPKKISNLYQFERVHTLQNVGKLNSFNKNFQNFFTIKIFSVAVRSEKIWTTSVYHNFLKYPKKILGNVQKSLEKHCHVGLSICLWISRERYDQFKKFFHHYILEDVGPVSTFHVHKQIQRLYIFSDNLEIFQSI